MSEMASSITRQPAAAGTALTPVAAPGGRLGSLDAFRGAIMLLMASSGLGIPQVAKHFPGSVVWRFLGGQCEHTEWVGCSLWDLRV